MRVERFADEYDRVAPLLALGAASLRARDAPIGSPPLRWLALDGDEVVGVATAWLRPDQRMLLRYAVTQLAAYRPLTHGADTELRRSLTTIADADAPHHLDALQAAGYLVEARGEAFRVRFDHTLRLVRRAWIPSGYRIERADAVDEAQLFALDNALRDLVPGSDGWRGDRRLFREELTSPECDPSAYLVARETTAGQLVGLVRIWRNPSGPRVGLIGVLPEHRAKPLAAALLKEALAAASTWGFDEFVTETSPDNRHTYGRVLRLGAESTARFVQLTRPTSEAQDPG